MLALGENSHACQPMTILINKGTLSATSCGGGGLEGISAGLGDDGERLICMSVIAGPSMPTIGPVR